MPAQVAWNREHRARLEAKAAAEREAIEQRKADAEEVRAFACRADSSATLHPGCCCADARNLRTSTTSAPTGWLKQPPRSGMGSPSHAVAASWLMPRRHVPLCGVPLGPCRLEEEQLQQSQAEERDRAATNPWGRVATLVELNQGYVVSGTLPPSAHAAAPHACGGRAEPPMTRPLLTRPASVR